MTIGRRKALALLWIGVVLAGCFDEGDPAGSSPTSAAPSEFAAPPAEPTVDELGDALGCDVERVEITEDDFSFTDTGDCSTESRFMARIHTYRLDLATHVRRLFSTRYATDEFPNCLGDASVPWVVLGTGWAAVFPTRGLATDAANGLGGQVLTEFEGEGPPISYPYPYCTDA